ncbi:hypothetical protein EUGRSUZ_J03193 [Eucalyptus grandis]|uniref:Uncharacterized protein n=2 Tax=Eucalyptus grandis TaxID=71139 RepID=A0ACC3JBD4_EUCGR|nr:hypothetical protein EUGRSUZ_J03193 [Eucalyptus grandis]
MGQGQEVKTRNDSQVDIQERGEIFFFHRPKVEREAAHSADDVQRLYMVLRPESGERPVQEKQDPKRLLSSPREASHALRKCRTQEVNIEKQALLRLVVMGKKNLPDPTKRSLPYLGFAEMVTTNIDDVKSALKAVYRIVRHKSSGKRAHTHLIYRLEFPPEEEKQEPQESPNVRREGSFLIQIKNPEQQQQQHGKRKAFGQLRYSPADPPDFLSNEGCELPLISASDDIEEELGMELVAGGEGDLSCSDLLKTFGDGWMPSPGAPGSI